MNDLLIPSLYFKIISKVKYQICNIYIFPNKTSLTRHSLVSLYIKNKKTVQKWAVKCRHVPNIYFFSSLK